MIKVITAIVCAFAAMLMIILSVSTTYWLQWQISSDGRNITHFRGLFRHCWESRDNVTNELQTYDGRTGCEGEFTDFKKDWNGVTIAFMILGLLFHLIAFIVAVVAACRKGHPFPSLWVAGIFFVAAILVIIALLVYTFHNWQNDVYFSWSYGGGWSTVALSIIAMVLIMADR